MSIDEGAMFARMYEAVDAVVGESLSKFEGRPAIYDADDRYPTTGYPLVRIAIGARVRHGGHSTYKTNLSDGNTLTVVTYTYPIQVVCYSTQASSRKATEIISDIQSSFVRPSINRMFLRDGLCTVSDVSENITQNSVKQGDDVVKSASIFVNLTCIDNVKDPYERLSGIGAEVCLRQEENTPSVAVGGFTTDHK